MTSDSPAPTSSGLSNTNDYTNEILSILDRHSSTLSKQQQAAIDEIDKWRHTWKDNIKQHASEQKRLLNESYGRLRYAFDEKRKTYLEMAKILFNEQRPEALADLHDACKMLKFQVAQLQMSQYEAERPKIIEVEEKVEEMQLDKFDKDLKKDARIRRRIRKESEKNAENTNSNNLSSSLNSITSDSSQTKVQKSLETRSETDTSQLTSTMNDVHNQVQDKDDSLNKCPICFMIFPASMKTHKRNKHVNAHMMDD